jgi:hypothetical protein
MANVHPKQMAKHLTFFQTGVLRPGLMALPAGAATATILTGYSSLLRSSGDKYLYRERQMGSSPQSAPIWEPLKGVSG